MSDNLEVRGGGGVVVDTETLQGAARSFLSLAGELAEICTLIASAGSSMGTLSRVAEDASWTAESARRRVLTAEEDASSFAAELQTAAAVYETVELRAERGIAAAAGDAAEMSRIDRRLASLDRQFPGAADEAGAHAFEHWLRWPGELARQAPGAFGWLVPTFGLMAVPMAWGMQQTIAAAGAGTVARSARLTGGPRAVTVTALPSAPPWHLPAVVPVALGAPGGPFAASGIAPVLAPTGSAAPVTASPPPAAPSSLASAAGRIPGGGEARVRVERYDMPDGTRQFAVYVAGTQSAAPGDDPFDMQSNLELYGGMRSASYDATLAALEHAGARSGDAVHAFGHSQGGMIAAHLALESDYDTRTLVSFGSPVDADVGPGTLSVAVRHRDDPVASLAGGGHVGSVGAPGSFVAERTADPALGMHDWTLPAHGIDGYTITAQQLDASRDPRMEAVRAVLGELAAADAVTVTEYAARRGGPGGVSPSSSGAG